MKKWIFIFLCVFLLKLYSFSQCPQFYDFDGILTSNPEWVVCDGNWQYLWFFGNDSESQLENPNTHTYSDYGDYAIKLIMSNSYSCTDPAIQWIEILPNMPIADFTVEGKGCAPLIVNFNNLSQNATSYSWDFGDGYYSNQENPTKIYEQEGIYTVSLTAISDSGSHSISKANSIEVFKKPNSRFLVNSDYIEELGIALETTNQSEYADSYLWDFGDFSTSTDFSPSHHYLKNGKYTITLISYNTECSDTSTKNVSIANSASGHIIVPNSFTPNTNNEISENMNKDGINDVFYPVVIGAKSYKLDIYNRWGEHLFQSDELEKGWDGYFKGQLCQQDVYVYKIHVVYYNNSEDKLVGNLTLIR